MNKIPGILFRWKLRLLNCYWVLTSEHILIHSIERKNGMTQWSTTYRTSNSDEHDFWVVKGAAIRKLSKLPPEVQAEQTI